MSKKWFIAGCVLVLVFLGCGMLHAETADANAKAADVNAKTPAGPFVLRVNCGAVEPYTDAAGNVWQPDQILEEGNTWGAEDGMTVDRGELKIEGSDVAKVYETERYMVSAYKFQVPNGKYTVRMHFAETYAGIGGEEERVFSVSINGETVAKDIDPFKDGGGLEKPVVKEFKGVAIANGELVIGFEMNIENPEVNGIEIIAE
ncbi:MAG: malectin domain-containing carbohydrate-binding protein [Phycisphaerae bacterium]